MLLEMPNRGGEDDPDEDDEDEDEDLDRRQQFDEAHRLVRSIHRRVPNMLQSVMPQLEQELQLNDVQVRDLATRTLADIFSDASPTLKQYANTCWKMWLGKENDKSAVVRTTFVHGLGKVIKDHPEIVQDVCPTLKSKLQDPEEKVRLAACDIFKSMSSEVVINHLPEELINTLAERILDKKVTLLPRQVFLI